MSLALMDFFSWHLLLSSKRFKESSRNCSPRLHPALFLRSGFCLVERRVLPNSVLLIECLTHCLFFLPSFNLHSWWDSWHILTPWREPEESPAHGGWIHGGLAFSGGCSVLYLLVLPLSLWTPPAFLLDDRTSFVTAKVDLTTDLKDSSNVLLFVLADCTNGPTTFVLGVVELAWQKPEQVLSAESRHSHLSAERRRRRDRGLPRP